MDDVIVHENVADNIFLEGRYPLFWIYNPEANCRGVFELSKSNTSAAKNCAFAAKHAKEKTTQVKIFFIRV